MLYHELGVFEHRVQLFHSQLWCHHERTESVQRVFLASAYNFAMTLSEMDFRTKSDEALNKLNRGLGVVAEAYDAEVMFQNGVLTIETEEPNPGKIVVSPNAPVRQIWISALSRSFKLDWSGQAFVFTTGETLDTLLGRLIGEQLGIDPIQL